MNTIRTKAHAIVAHLPHLRSIRERVLVAVVGLVLATGAAVGVGLALVGFRSARDQAIDHIDAVLALREVELQVWSDAMQSELVNALSDPDARQEIAVALDLAHTNQNYGYYSGAVHARLSWLTQQSTKLNDICLLDTSGTVVLCAAGEVSGTNCYWEEAFWRGLHEPYVRFRFNSTFATGTTGADVACTLDVAGDDQPYVLASRPVAATNERTVGVIVGRADLQGLAAILSDRRGLGGTGKVSLLTPAGAFVMDPPDDSGGSVLGGSRLRIISPSAEFADTLSAGTTGWSYYDDYRGSPVLGVYHQVPGTENILVAEEDVTEVFSTIVKSIALSGLVAVAAALLGGVVALFVARTITRPLVRLAGTAAEIAEGNLSRTAAVERDDEIGALAATFNAMTGQLRDSIGNLEQHVQERTQALEVANSALQRKALQLQAGADVSHEVSSILEVDDLLARVVSVICTAFGFAQARVFLLEEGRLVLRAGTLCASPIWGQESDGGMQPHMAAVQSGVPVVSSVDVAGESSPGGDRTNGRRSELAVPLRLGDRIIGTLGVQSDGSAAFSPDDVIVIEGLGLQVAVAIENARLYKQSSELAAIAERSRLARDLHDSVVQSLYSLNLLVEGWRRLAGSGNLADPEACFERIGEIGHQALKEMRLLVYERWPANLGDEGLVGALELRLRAVERRAGLSAHVIATDPIELSSFLQEELYAIAQEALNNALKHAKASQVTVRLAEDYDMVVLEIADNGIGFDVVEAERQGGMGLGNMRQRAGNLAGCLQIESTPGQGTTVRARVPWSGKTAG